MEYKNKVSLSFPVGSEFIHKSLFLIGQVTHTFDQIYEIYIITNIFEVFTFLEYYLFEEYYQKSIQRYSIK